MNYPTNLYIELAKRKFHKRLYFRQLLAPGIKLRYHNGLTLIIRTVEYIMDQNEQDITLSPEYFHDKPKVIEQLLDICVGFKEITNA